MFKSKTKYYNSIPMSEDTKNIVNNAITYCKENNVLTYAFVIYDTEANVNKAKAMLEGEGGVVLGYTPESRCNKDGYYFWNLYVHFSNRG